MKHRFLQTLFVALTLLALTFGALGVTPAYAAIDSSTFAPKVDYATGTGPNVAETGDIDGDGKPDVVALGQGNNTIGVFRNTSTSGSISFATRADFTTGSGPFDVKIADIDGDGKLDVEVSNQGGKSISVFRNTSTVGTISFASRLDFGTGGMSTTALGIGDLDGDGKPDMAAGDYNQNRVYVFQNTSTVGSVSFAAPTNYSINGASFDVAIADLDGDGKADMITTGTGMTSVFRNTSTVGTISFAARVDPLPFVYFVNIADVDGDGKLDVAGTPGTDISVYRNTSTSGNISFASGASFVAGTSYGSAIGDLDQDAKPDLVVAGYSTNSVAVLRNTSTSGSISFAGKVDFAAGTNPYMGPAVTDLDGDGKADLVVPNQGSNNISVFRNTTPTPPTVTTVSIETLQNRAVNASLDSLGDPASVSAYGVVYNTTGSPTLSDSKVDKGAIAVTGAYNVGLDEMGLTPGAKYYVRAFATNATDTAYGAELVVYGTPEAFAITAPLAGATDVPTSPTLSWDASTGATDYQYCIAVDVMADCAADLTGPNWLSTGGSTSVPLLGLAYGTTYGWAVRAVVGTPPSYRWSTGAPFTFTTVNVYTVTYDGNGSDGGAVPVDNNSYFSGDTVTVLGNTGALTKTGNTFIGWNTAADGSGISYHPGDTFAIGAANVTLYANWTTLPTYTVTYDGNGSTGGAVPVDGNNYLSGATVTVLGNTGALAKTGYTFAGWNTAMDGSGTNYNAGDTFAMGAANVTLYAKWTALPTYTVTYDGNGSTGGAVPVDSNNYLSGATVTVLGNTGALVKTGYAFASWNTAMDGSGTNYNAGDIFAMGSANVSLYAKWTPTYTVTYDGNGSTGGAVPADANSYLSGATVTVLGNTGALVKSGYTFAGWNTAMNGSGIGYNGGDTFAMGSANVTLYAQWTALPTYTVTYDGNGSTGGAVPVDANNYLSGDTVTVLGNTGALVKAGYTFAGWNTAMDGSGTSYIAGDTFPMGAANVSLYAKWTLNVVAPTAVTNAASALRAVGATLNGTVNAQGDSTTVTFEYGKTIAYGSSVTAAQSPVTGSSDTAVSAILIGLAPNTTYHFRVVAQNAGGTTQGLDMTFKTSTLIERLKNGGFETYLGISRIPRFWTAVKFSKLVDGKDATVKKTGKFSVKITGSAAVAKTLSQTVAVGGVAGDPFNFSVWVKGTSLAKTGICQAQVLLYSGTKVVQINTVKCSTGTFTWKQMKLNFTATKPYTKFVVKITFKKAGTVWFDLASLKR